MLFVRRVVRLWVKLMISNNQIAKIICVACSEPIGDHKRRELWRCLFRIQGTYVSESLQNKPPKNDTK